MLSLYVARKHFGFLLLYLYTCRMSLRVDKIVLHVWPVLQASLGLLELFDDGIYILLILDSFIILLAINLAEIVA